MVDTRGLERGRSVLLLRNLKRGETLAFWFNPEDKSGRPVLLVEKDPARLRPKVQRELLLAPYKDKLFEGSLSRDDSGRLAFSGEGGASVQRIKERLRLLAKDPDWKPVRAGLERPSLSAPDGTQLDEDSEEDSEDWEEIAEVARELLVTTRTKLGGDSPEVAELERLKKQAFSSRKTGRVKTGVGFLGRLVDKAREVLGKQPEGSGTPKSGPETELQDEWLEIQQQSKELYSNLRTTLPGSPTLSEVDELRRQAVEAKRKGDLEASVGLFRRLVETARGALEGGRRSPAKEELLAVRSRVQERWTELRKATGPGDPSFDRLEKLRVDAVVALRSGDPKAALRLFTRLEEEAGAVVQELEELDPTLGDVDWEQVVAQLKLALRRVKPSWFWYCRQGSGDEPVLIVEPKEATMRLRGRAALLGAKQKKNLSGWITRDEAGRLVLWCEGALPLPQAEKDWKTVLPALEPLRPVATLVRKATFRLAAEAGPRPVDDGSPDSLLDEPTGAALARRTWAEARAGLRSDLQGLQKALRVRFPDEPGAAAGLDLLLDEFDDELLTWLDAAAKASGEAKEKALRSALQRVETYEGRLDANPLVRHLDRNRLHRITVEKDLTVALKAVRAAL